MQVEFKQTFDELGKLAQRHSYSEVFKGFLTILLNYLADGQYQHERDVEMQRFSDEEKKQFNQVFYSFFAAQEQYWSKNKDAKWLDVLGQFYEEITSRSKSSAMGQFFTPPCVCDIMAAFTVEENDSKKTAADPCSGSGRLILAAHAINPRLQFTAIDKDYICVLMTTINMQMHGCLGVVYWGDALCSDVWGAFEIKPHPIINIPYIRPFEPNKETFKNVVEKTEQPPALPEPPVQHIISDPNTGEPEQTKQLTLF